MDTSLEVFFVAAAVLYALYYYLTMHFDFWKVRGIPGPKPIPLFGNAYRYMVGKTSMPAFLMDLHQKYKREPVVGIIQRRTPILVVKDPELIQDVLIKDFSKFMDRQFPKPEVADPLSAHLFALEAKRWKPLRTQLTPVFTSGKLKGMFSMILECSEHLENYLDKLLLKEEFINVRHLAGQFTVDVITNCAFGIQTNSLSEKECQFRAFSRELFAIHPIAVLRNQMRECFTELYDLLGYVVPYDEMYRFFIRAVTDLMEYRTKNNIVRSDFINVLLELEKHPEKLYDTKVTKEYLTAQAFAFFGAGFETSGSTISNTLYELALNPNIQDKLRHEILEHKAKHNGEWKYETVQAMEYLDKIFKETLRKYSPVSLLTRIATGDYTFENPHIWIPKGTTLWIPVHAIHHDPDIYPNPGIYDPERFNADVVKTRHPMNQLPFGAGPRNCIGARFAAYQTKIAVIKIIGKYKIEPCEKTPSDPYELNPFALTLTPKEEMYLKITQLKN